MRIVQVASSYHPRIGGIETHVRRLAQGLVQAGEQVTVITHQFDNAQAEEWDGNLRVLRFPLAVASRNYPISPAMFHYLKSHAADFDIVHGHNYHSIVGHAAAGTRLPFVFTPHYNATGHTWFRTRLHRLYRRIGARQFAAANAVICVSDAEREALIRTFPDAAVKMVTIPNGTDPKPVAAGQGAGQAEGPVLLTVGRLERYKNVDLVIDAFRALPGRATLVVVGDGPDRARLERHVRASGPSGPIHFTGRVPDPVLDDLFARASVVASASDHEAFGLTLAEGLASGARVVASAIPAHADLARRAGEGSPVALVDPRNARQFAAALEDALRAGRVPAGDITLPSWAEVVRETRELYSRVTAERQSAGGRGAGLYAPTRRSSLAAHRDYSHARHIAWAVRGMTGQHAAPARGLPRLLNQAGSDSLVRNSVYMMATTVVTAGLGYVFWALAAHAFSKQEIGLGSAVISLCTTVALMSSLGPCATLIERLPGSERSSAWTTVLIRMCLVTAAVTLVVTVVIVPVLQNFSQYRPFFGTAPPAILAVAGATSWTLVDLFGAVFIAARRAGRLLSIQALVSASKVLLVLPFAAVGASAAGLVGAWVASAMIGVSLGTIWLIPQMGLGRRLGDQTRRRIGAVLDRRPRPAIHWRRRAQHRRPPAPPSKASMQRMLGQHLTSVGGALTPLLLPTEVVLRLGATANAYFYITWMVGSAFFMVSPSVASALFAEGMRVGSDLRKVTARAMKAIAMLLVPAMAVMIVGGRLVLGLFGASYAGAGYGLLVLLAVSALPDAVSNIAVTIFRVTHRLGYSTMLNLGILIATLTAAWVLMPSLGIAGAGAAWLGAQIIGAAASLPAYVQIIRHPAAGQVRMRPVPGPTGTAAPRVIHSNAVTGWPRTSEVA
jgi:1,2-diacylglycerol 3-alpha-glucosyltransferase